MGLLDVFGDILGGGDVPKVETGFAPGALGQQANRYLGNFNMGQAHDAAAANIKDILRQKGRTDPDLFNRILAGSGRATQSALTDLNMTQARSGMQSGIADALNAAIQLEGADREAGIRAQEATIAEERRRTDQQLFAQTVLMPLLEALGVDVGANTANANLQAQVGNRGLQALGILTGGLTSLGRRGGGDKDGDG